MKQRKTEGCVFKKSFREGLILISGSVDAQTQSHHGGPVVLRKALLSRVRLMSETAPPGDNQVKENADVGIESASRTARTGATVKSPAQ